MSILSNVDRSVLVAASRSLVWSGVGSARNLCIVRQHRVSYVHSSLYGCTAHSFSAQQLYNTCNTWCALSETFYGCHCRNENTKDEKSQVQYLIYCLEHASRLADEYREYMLQHTRSLPDLTWTV